MSASSPLAAVSARADGPSAHVLELGVGFQYFHSMFGKDASRVPGADEFTPVLSLAVHLPLGGSGH